ncbi:extracellular solute-binding protein [Paenibacillus sp. FSL P4-0338]|uniref:sugar ABC transporter substrate-binding protein n=1 Tax=unclassified Paenibacillus TaxID=185978 RepID=UPI0003E2984F|nr:extracellular solute-binding protein [Paenibacillus sp. FSL R7-269]ETT47442.1 extracellular solute-binding protein domain-containing protein [Paenibacillus sp. FSL R7-269]
MEKNNKEIVLWHEFDGPGDTSIEVLEGICKLYTERFSVQITPQVMNITDLTARLNRIKHTRQGPYLAMVPADMSSYVDNGLYSEVPGGLFEDVLTEEALSTMQMEGVQYGIPVLRGNHLVLYYNPEIYPSAPATWDVFEEAAERLTAQGIVPIGADLQQGYWFIPFLTAFGGWPVQNGKPNIVSPEMKQALEFIRDKMDQGVLVSLDGSTGLLEQFIDGKIGAIICGEWIYNHLDKHMNDRLEVCQLPVIEGQQSLSMSSSIGLIYPNFSLTTEEREDILSFTRFMLSDECQTLWTQGVQRIPAQEQVLHRLSASAAPNKRMILSLLDHTRPMPTYPFMIHVWEALNAGLIELPLSNPEQALKKMEQTLQASWGALKN